MLWACAQRRSAVPLAEVEEEGAQFVGREERQEALERARHARVGGDVEFLVPQLREHIVQQDLTLCTAAKRSSKRSRKITHTATDRYPRTLARSMYNLENRNKK
jgi:hypothetical protein